MKKLKHILTLATFAATIHAHGQFVTLWSEAYNGPAQNARDRANCVAVDRLGNTFVAGESGQSLSGQDMVVVKYGPLGGLPLFERKIPAVSTGTDTPFAMVIDDFGDVYLTGESQNGPVGTAGNKQFRTVKLRGSDLTILWNKAYSYNGQESWARDLAVNKDGHVFVVGTTQSGGSPDILTIRYDESGNMVTGWPTVFDHSGTLDEGVGIAVGPGDNVFVTGIVNRGGSTGDDWVTMRYAGSGGDPLWVKFVSSAAQTGQKRDFPTDITVDSQNNVFVCGVLYPSDGDSNAGLVSYDISGTARFSHANERRSGIQLEPKHRLRGCQRSRHRDQ